MFKTNGRLVFHYFLIKIIKKCPTIACFLFFPLNSLPILFPPYFLYLLIARFIKECYFCCLYNLTFHSHSSKLQRGCFPRLSSEVALAYCQSVDTSFAFILLHFSEALDTINHYCLCGPLYSLDFLATTPLQ